MQNESDKKKNSFGYQLKSFSFAIRGLTIFFKSEAKAMIHSSAALAAIVLGFLFKISGAEWILIIIVIGMVLITEITNTVAESLVDIISPEFSEKAGKIKDLMAGAVLVSALTALAVGIVIFVPKVFNLL